jgi:hypothetical protein
MAKLRELSWDQLRESLDWNESNPREVATTLDEVKPGADSTSSFVAEAWVDKSSSPSTNLSRSLRGSAAEVFGFMSTRNRRKLPAPSVMQTHEPKTNVVPWEGTDLENWKVAIKLAGGSSTRTPTWRASCRCFTGCPPRDIPKVVSFGWGDAEIRNSKVQGTRSLDRFGPLGA